MRGRILFDGLKEARKMRERERENIGKMSCRAIFYDITHEKSFSATTMQGGGREMTARQL